MYYRETGEGTILKLEGYYRKSGGTIGKLEGVLYGDWGYYIETGGGTMGRLGVL